MLFQHNFRKELPGFLKKNLQKIPDYTFVTIFFMSNFIALIFIKLYMYISSIFIYLLYFTTVIKPDTLRLNLLTHIGIVICIEMNSKRSASSNYAERPKKKKKFKEKKYEIQIKLGKTEHRTCHARGFPIRRLGQGFNNTVKICMHAYFTLPVRDQ